MNILAQGESGPLTDSPMRKAWVPSSLPAHALWVALIALLYLATAKLGFLFSLPPGNVTAVWIPSGIALAAMVALPRSGALGVWLGSFLVNLLSLGSAGAGALVSAAIATGSTLQGALAAVLLRRLVLEGAPQQVQGMAPGHATLRAAAILIPASLIAAVFGVSSLVGAGFAPRASAGELFVTWWLGDLAGIFLIGMPLLAFRALMGPAGRGLLPGALALAFCVAGAGVLCWVVLAQLNRSTFDARMQSSASLLAEDMRNVLGSHALYGRATGALMSGTEVVSPDRFARFSDSLLQGTTAVSAVSFLAQVSAERRKAFEDGLRARGVAQPGIWERGTDGARVPAQAKPSYVPVQLIHPLQGNSAALGFDISSEPRRALALRRALAEDSAISTPPLRLVQDASAGLSLLIVEPVWRDAPGHNRAAPDASTLLGFSSVVIRLAPLFEQTLRAHGLQPMRAGLLYRPQRGDQPDFGAWSVEGSAPPQVQDWLSGEQQQADFEFAGGFWSVVLKLPDNEIWAIRGIGALPWALLSLFLLLAGAIVHHAAGVRQRQLAVEQSEARFRGLLESAPDAMVIVDAQGHIVLVNAQTEQLFAYPRDEILGQPVEMLVPDGARSAHARHRAGFLQAPRKRTMAAGLELNGRRKDGSEFPVEISLSPIESGGEIMVSAAIRDLSERKRIELQLRESRKLEAMGQLAGGLAHDFNNLVGVVVGNLDEMAAQIPAQNEKLMRHHRSALEASLKGAELTRALLAVAQRQPMKLEPLELNALASEVLPLLRSSAGASVSVRTELSEAQLPVRADASALSGALLQLALNARDAMQGMSGEQRLLLRTSQVSLRPAANEQLKAGDYAVLEVHDNGPGMSQAVRERAFDPFFTTKEVGNNRGTGLGLAVVLGTLEQLGGTVKIDSASGRGTTVRLYLPLQPPSPASSLKPN